MSRIDQPRMTRALRRYFASGWAFLIPYLAVYLLYYATDWPVNPASDSESGESAMPSLLHVYWALHALNLALGAMALWASTNAKSEEGMVNGENNAPGRRDQGRAQHRHQLRAMSPKPLAAIIRRFHSLVPLRSSLFHRPSPFTLHDSLFWAILALIFYIPGVYLEWPSDPWEHLRRINEWHATATVGAHSCWYKSAYFIPYSLLSWATGLRQLFWLDFYYTGICLLLCWQYYRLARVCGLSERASNIFVLIQAILFGNNIFSFYRYYGISSSIYAQIGAVAITRIALEFATRGTSKEQHNGWTASENIRERPFWHWPTLLKAILPAIACLVPFVAFNHQQGIGIAALGVLAIGIWRTIEWKRSAMCWLIAGTLIFNALFLWLYPKPQVIEIYRANGALNAWYGFNIFDFTHPIGDRMLQIVSAFGLVNILAALLLLRRNHVSAWLTISPLIALSLPCISIPFATALSKSSSIITFQRMLFAIPVGLAVVQGTRPTADSLKPQGAWHISLILYSALLAIMALPCGGPSYNRIWNATTPPPKDLQLHHTISETDDLVSNNNVDAKLVVNKTGTAILAFYPFELFGAPTTREFWAPSSAGLSAALGFLEFDEPSRKILSQKAHPTPRLPANGGANLVPTNTPARWIILGGYRPKLYERIADKKPSAVVIRNPKGLHTDVFTAELIPIHRGLSYRLAMSVKQLEATEATVYLAVAWYDAQGKLLEGNVVQPAGAGSPRGWANGTYCYFGLVAQTPHTTWATYSITFGFHETAGIPTNAQFIRVGALLNYNRTPNAEILLTDIQLVETPPPAVIAVQASTAQLYSHKSIAAQLSKHWPCQEIMASSCGSPEIMKAYSESLPTPTINHRK